MGYRSDEENLRARVGELERELADAHDTIGRLTGLGPAPAREEHNAILDAPKLVELEREMDFEIEPAGLEAIAELLRERLGLQAQQVGQSLRAPGFSLTQRDGMTQVSMRADFRRATIGALAASALVGGFGSLIAFAIAHDFAWRQLSEANVLWMAPLLIGLLFAFPFRPLTGASVRERAQRARATFEAVVELAQRHRLGGRPKARVELGDDEEDGVEIEEGLGVRVASDG